jgi:hypothetical protein
MKKPAAVLLFFFLYAGAFAQETEGFTLTELEKRIVLASPEEMLDIVLDPAMERPLRAIYLRYEEGDLEVISAAYLAAFPGTDETECQVMLLKLGLVSSIGSGDRELFDQGMEALDFCATIDTMLASGEVPQDIAALAGNIRWRDCVAFAGLFDADSFIARRFPDE